jgi:hypothetical protein
MVVADMVMNISVFSVSPPLQALPSLMRAKELPAKKAMKIPARGLPMSIVDSF